MKRLPSGPAITAELSWYADSTPSGEQACVLRIMPNRECSIASPSIVQSALKIL